MPDDVRAVAEAGRIGPASGLSRVRAVVAAHDVQLGVVGLNARVEDRDVDVEVRVGAVRVCQRADAPDAWLDLRLGRRIWVARGVDGHVRDDGKHAWIAR